MLYILNSDTEDNQTVTGAENKTPREKMLYRCYQAVEVMKNNDYE